MLEDFECTYIYAYIHTYIHTYIYRPAYAVKILKVHTYICTYIHISDRIVQVVSSLLLDFVYAVHVYTDTRRHTVQTHIYVYIYIYTYMYVQTHMHIYIYIYTYIRLEYSRRHVPSSLMPLTNSRLLNVTIWQRAPLYSQKRKFPRCWYPKLMCWR